MAERLLRLKKPISGAGLLMMMALIAVGCGTDQARTDDANAAEELAREHEIEQAKKQAAEDAVQSHRIKELEKELEKTRREPSASSAPEPAPVVLSIGDWPGGAGFTTIIGSFRNEGDAEERQAEATKPGPRRGGPPEQRFLVTETRLLGRVLRRL